MLTYLYNANIHTMNPAAPRTPHMLLSGDKIWHCAETPAPLGLDFRDSAFAATRKQLARDVQFIDLGGRTIIPGLVDSHVHFIWWALNLRLADLNPARSEDDALRLLQEHSGNTPAGEWIVGFGWSHNLWDQPRLPSAASLDAAFPNNPVYLSSKCGHLAWVNTAALSRAGITDSTADPFGGEIERKSGRATGILKETANALVHDRIDAATHQQRLDALRKGQQLAHSLGITGMQTPEDLETWSFLQRAHSDGELTMRINFWIPVAALDSLEAGKNHHALGDNLLRISHVKLFSDGSLGGRTALMHEPYENESDNLGICVCEADDIREITLRANRAGLPMAIHAIGDKANSNVLAAYEAAQEELGASGAAGVQPLVRNRIEHLQVFHPTDLDRIRKIRPVASMQPVHLCADMGPADKFWGDRAQRAYAFRTLADAGCTLAFGSDAPVEPINPFFGLYAATTRRNLEGAPAEGWYPDEKIDLHSALQAYTINPAVASGQSNILGSLEPGKLADFIVLDEDPYTLTPESLRDTKPTQTWSAGKCVYDSQT